VGEIVCFSEGKSFFSAIGSGLHGKALHTGFDFLFLALAESCSGAYPSGFSIEIVEKPRISPYHIINMSIFSFTRVFSQSGKGDYV